MAGRDTQSAHGAGKVDLKHFYANPSPRNVSTGSAASEGRAQAAAPSVDAPTVREEQPVASEPPAAAPVRQRRVENPQASVPDGKYLALLSSVSAGEEALELGLLLEECGTTVCYLLNSLSDVRKNVMVEDKLQGASAMLLVLSGSDRFPSWWKNRPECESAIVVYLDEKMDATVTRAATGYRVVRAYGYPDSEKLATQISRLLAASGVVDCETAGFEMPMKKRESLVGSWNYARNKLDSAQRALYDLLLEKIKALEPIKAGDYIDEAAASIPLVMASIEADHPELFWIRGYQEKNFFGLSRVSSQVLEANLNADGDVFKRIAKMADLDGDGRVSITERFGAFRIYCLARAPELLWAINKKLKPPTGWTYRSAQDASTRVASMTELLKQELPDRASDYEILRFFYDCVCRPSLFKTTAAMDPEDTCFCGSGKLYRNCHKFIAERLQTLRSAFEAEDPGRLNGAGRSRMLQYLLLACGIPCITMTGVMMTGNRENMHTWNYVQIDGVWNIVDVAMGSCDVEKYPSMLGNCPDWAKGDYVRYQYLCADKKDYEPAPAISAPSLGTTSDYFANEGNLLSRDDIPSFVRSFAKLLCGVEAFIELKCVEDVEGTSEWVTKNVSVARAAYAAAMLDYDRLCANTEMYVRDAGKQVGVDQKLEGAGIKYGFTKWVDVANGTITICLLERPPVRR